MTSTLEVEFFGLEKKTRLGPAGGRNMPSGDGGRDAVEQSVLMKSTVSSRTKPRCGAGVSMSLFGVG